MVEAAGHSPDAERALIRSRAHAELKRQLFEYAKMISTNREIAIGGRVYRKNPEVDRYQVHLGDLGDLRMSEIPPHSHLEILGLPEPNGVSDMECYGLNSGDEGQHENLSIYGGASFKVSADNSLRMVSRLRRAFPDERDCTGCIRNPVIHTKVVEDGIVVHVFLNLDFQDKPETFVRDAVIPFVEGYRRMLKPSVHAFICHASEDKSAARSLATAMTKFGAEVWFDEWEIRVGDSIVQKIGDALGAVSHLIVMLSQNSVSKPWVQKELSSALMRQLSEKSITVLPLRLDDCSIPTILADVKYADARRGLEYALAEIETALFSNPKASEP